MKIITHKKLALTAVIAALLSMSNTTVQAQESDPSYRVKDLDFTGELAPRLYFFNYFDGVRSERNQFLERYNYQRGFGGDNRSGFYADANFRLVGSNAERDVFVLERQGFGAFNNRQKLAVNTANWGLSSYYTDFRSAAGGLKYLYSPNQVPGGTDPSYFFPAGTNTNTGYAAQFNDDSGQGRYTIDRETYGVGIKLKPELFNADTTVAVNYDGYSRNGNRFASYVLGGSDVSGSAARVLQRWRGFNMPINENMNRTTLSASGSPMDFYLSYEGSVERFNNQAQDFRIADVASSSTFLVSSNKPLQFVPDSTQISNNFRLSKTLGSTALAAGYGLSILDQDSFSAQQIALGYDRGNLHTNNAFFTFNSNAMRSVGLEGYVKYYERSNGSSFPVTGLVSATAGEKLDVRINNVQSVSYGLSAAFRPGFWSSSLTTGWKREDRDRDLTWTAVLVPGLNGIQPQRSLYSEKTLSDEVYANFVARPMAGLLLRVTPSYVWADDTGLITEPEKAYGLKSTASYAAQSGWMMSGYFNYKNQQNTTKFFTDALTAPVTDGPRTHQDAHRIQRAAGLAFSKPFGEWINTSANFGWMQNDVTAYFLQSSRRRYEAPNRSVLFVTLDRPDFNVDSYVFSLNGDWQTNDALSFNGGYTYSKSNGNTASGLVLAAIPTVDGRIDNTVHTLEVGAKYALKESLSLNATYTYDQYKDRSFDALSGGFNTIMLGATMSF
ncbi:MAG: hypothetical protein COS34_02175 [Lysobacterales bacterium CG02_land_8_20_14_3_00_62_12]|nr:MAG: hypothetical protein COS34_02175 [Xanthomonadales bacterium CG02_land_8_20_14_3_00_62_12]